MNTSNSIQQMAEHPLHGNQPSEPEGVIFEIERWSTRDGPGIRTVIFFKGCPLRCKWCCNPESWSPGPQIAYFEERCSGCGRCQDVCPRGVALPASDGGVEDRSACTACGQCVAVCPAGAREVMGEKLTVENVLSVVERDRVFYRQSGGGVTFSGGEALAQPGFLRKVTEQCWKLGISMVLETSGLFSWNQCGDILARMGMVFLDIKHMDPDVHKRMTGVENQNILRNGIRLVRNHIPLVVRVPLIPTINDGVENIKATAAFMSENLKGALGVEVLPYHNLGKGKFKPIGLEYQLDHIDPPQASALAEVKEIFSEFGIEVLHFGSVP